MNDQRGASSTDINMFQVLDSLDCELKVTRAPPRNIPRIVQEAPEAPAGRAKKRILCAGQVNSNTARVAGASSIVGFSPQDLEPENASQTDARDHHGQRADEATEPKQECEYTWGNADGAAFKAALEETYAEVVHWRRNIFMVPSGAAGKEFVREISRLFDSFTQQSALEAISIRAIMTMPHLLLQKPDVKSKAKEHLKVLERRLVAWRNGDIQELVLEGRAIQSHLSTWSQTRKRTSEETLARSFGNLIHQGRVRAALRLLDNSQVRGGVLPLDAVIPEADGKCVRQVLREKHPKGEAAQQEVLLDEPIQSTPPASHHPVLFHQITAESIRAAALRVEGAAGPSGIDACGWRRMCTSFGSASDDLCRSLADFARRICSETVLDHYLSTYVACRLVPLDKSPGVRPIGICEVVRRIVGKAALQVVGACVQRAAGTTQLCAGQPMGIEAGIHAMQRIYDEDDCEAILMVDAANAFNRINRKAALHNSATLCPAIATLLNNTYNSSADLFVGGEVLNSEEGVTQGDPLAMAMYALGTVPLINELAKHVRTKQVWYADDASDGR